MKKCLNCKWNVRDTDTYCRNCGCSLQSNKNYIITNVIITFPISVNDISFNTNISAIP